MVTQNVALLSWLMKYYYYHFDEKIVDATSFVEKKSDVFHFGPNKSDKE